MFTVLNPKEIFEREMKKIYLITLLLFWLVPLMNAQTPVIYKDLKIDPLLCLQINNYEVAQSMEDLKKIPMKYNASCESIDFGKINFEKKSVIACSQYIRNGEGAIKSTHVEVLRNDNRKSIDVFFASFCTGQIQRPGKVYENRRWLMLPKFPEDYKVDVHYSLKVVEP